MKKIIITIICVVIFAEGIYMYRQHKSTSNKLTNTPTEFSYTKQGERELSLWTVYWDLDEVENEIALVSDRMKDLSLFSVYFDSNNNLLFGNGLLEFFNNQSVWKNDTYITVVNDLQNDDGSFSLKSTDLLKELFIQKDVTAKKLVDMACDNGFNGIELDFEAIKKDEKLWADFADFCTVLYDEADKNNLKLRIVLEPAAPVKSLNLPEGASYVMMCYNLYGSHSGPGPKADFEFINTVIENISYAPGEKSIALATGGFDWGADGKTVAATEKIAAQIAAEHGVTPTRDDKSMALTYTYQDHTVWYADAQTLDAWIAQINAAGDFDIALWRAGGNIW